jgi:hypothetical protein
MDYAFLSLWIVPLGVMLAVRVIPAQLCGLERACSGAEKAYWVLNLIGYLAVAYGTLSTGIIMLASLFGDGRQVGWVLPAWRLSGDPGIDVLLDLLVALTSGLSTICAARYFGYVDENDCWCRAEWLAEAKPGRSREAAGRPPLDSR